MGHMRCGSTLLMHILLTNPALIGCGERNAPYRSSADLDKLELAARWSGRRLFRNVPYVVDQINHDEFTPDLNLFQSDRLRCIFLIREPGQAIHSLLELTATSREPWNMRRAVDYYVRRLVSLEKYRERVGDRCIALTYSDLVDRTPCALRRLQSFLGLDSELRDEYALQPFTGRRGDPSDRIRAGRILPGRVPASSEAFQCERERAAVAYSSCLDKFRLR